MVGSQNRVAVPPRHGLFQKFIPQPPGGLLNGKTVPRRQRPGVAPAGGKRDAPRRTVIPDKRLVPVRRPAAQTVVEVSGGNANAPACGPADGKIQEAHGVQSSGHRA
ncbi:hypothetical protein SDC9_141168 [bioreactor metagenome]|uniref:Uncharacterized protein n=1 Tax=bioreactor metagenome TaxID=1076179 RepID=A0A645DXF9_9ZZZZ